MILTGSEIVREYRNGRIRIDPFDPEAINPNSYDFRLGSTYSVYRDFPLDPRLDNVLEEKAIPVDGLLVQPRRLYLCATLERMGSEHYAPLYAARSSIARLGVFINLSAPLGDIGYIGLWTLQIYAIHPVRLYPGMRIGQMMWWRPQGEIQLQTRELSNSTTRQAEESGARQSSSGGRRAGKG